MNKILVSIAILALGALPFHASAQQAGKVYRVAVNLNMSAATLAGPVPASGAMRALVASLKARGYIEGQNLIIDRWSRLGLDSAAADEQMAALVRQGPDVIVVDSILPAQRAAKVTSSIPIVMVASIDPVGAGLAESLAHPGRNVTGLTTDVGFGAEEKRLEIFHEMLPKMRRLAFVGYQVDWENDWGKGLRSAAEKLRLDFFLAEGKRGSFADAMETVKRERAEAIYIALSPSTGPFNSMFTAFTLANRVPSSCGIVEFAEQGCLMAYGQSYIAFFTQSAIYIDKILKGAKAGDLPIEQPTRFELVINMKTAKAIGVKIPQSVLLRADRLIE